VFEGLIIASGPTGARLRIGTSKVAQVEVKVPMTATTLGSVAYACAFALHRASSVVTVVGVESSQAWNAIAKRRARKPCSRSRSWIAASI
jgi:hypothetical protein